MTLNWQFNKKKITNFFLHYITSNFIISLQEKCENKVTCLKNFPIVLFNSIRQECFGMTFVLRVIFLFYFFRLYSTTPTMKFFLNRKYLTNNIFLCFLTENLCFSFVTLALFLLYNIYQVYYYIVKMWWYESVVQEMSKWNVTICLLWWLLSF